MYMYLWSHCDHYSFGKLLNGWQTKTANELQIACWLLANACKFDCSDAVIISLKQCNFASFNSISYSNLPFVKSHKAMLLPQRYCTLQNVFVLRAGGIHVACFHNVYWWRHDCSTETCSNGWRQVTEDTILQKLFPDDHFLNDIIGHHLWHIHDAIPSHIRNTS